MLISDRMMASYNEVSNNSLNTKPRDKKHLYLGILGFYINMLVRLLSIMRRVTLDAIFNRSG